MCNQVDTQTNKRVHVYTYKYIYIYMYIQICMDIFENMWTFVVVLASCVSGPGPPARLAGNGPSEEPEAGSGDFRCHILTLPKNRRYV